MLIKNQINKLIFFTFLTFVFLAISCFSYAGNGSDTPFNKIVFLGDSLSDNGNLYVKDIGFMPKSPPYYKGRFANGRVWSEYVADYFQALNIPSSNFANGGETTVAHNPFNGFLPYILEFSIDSYWTSTVFRDRSKTLFSLWIGSNDYLPGTKADEVESYTDYIIQNIQQKLERLIGYGGKNFLIINLPDLSRLPFAKENGNGENLGALIAAHNKKLAAMVMKIQEQYKNINIHLFDLNSLFVDVLTRTNFYNEKYHAHITNTTDACWQGNYYLHQKAQVSDVLTELQREVNDHTLQLKVGDNANRLNVEGLAHYITTSPALMEAYKTTQRAKEGQLPCANPDQYIFWDHVHPTGIVHTVLAENILDFINQNYSHT